VRGIASFFEMVGEFQENGGDQGEHWTGGTLGTAGAEGFFESAGAEF